jgi:glycosyltransferase involved in cell wall biosynthesis
MSKQLMLMVGPFSTRSGYGEHARDIFHSYYNMDKYEIKIIDTRWGDTPRTALDKDNLDDKKIIDCILPQPQLDRQPDICVDIRIPNEFNPVGKFNIGVTAGIETTAVSQKWIEGANKVDLMIVPSEHAKSGFVNTIYDKVQSLPDGQKQKIGEFRLETPIEVVFEGSDLDTYKRIKYDEINTELDTLLNDTIEEKFAFLFVGAWIKGAYGEDRKDIGRLIKVFYETFANQSKMPSLVLKTSGSNFSILDRQEILNKIKEIKDNFPKSIKLPNIYLLHGDLSSEEMNGLYNHPKIRSMVSFTHGEGFGRPLLEATLTGLPVIASNWSGHLDFLDSEYNVLIDGTLDNIPNGAVWENILIPESKWFTVNEIEASRAMSFVFKNIFDINVKAKSFAMVNREKFSHDNMTKKLSEIMDEYTSHISNPVELKLPKLKHINSEDKKTRISLPKLTKVK